MLTDKQTDTQAGRHKHTHTHTFIQTDICLITSLVEVRFFIVDL